VAQYSPCVLEVYASTAPLPATGATRATLRRGLRLTGTGLSPDRWHQLRLANSTPIRQLRFVFLFNVIAGCGCYLIWHAGAQNRVAAVDDIIVRIDCDVLKRSLRDGAPGGIALGILVVIGVDLGLR